MLIATYARVFKYPLPPSDEEVAVLSQFLLPPSDEGGGSGADGGRNKDKVKMFSLSLPQSFANARSSRLFPIKLRFTRFLRHPLHGCC